MKDDAERRAIARTDAADPVPHGDAQDSARAPDGAMMNREDDPATAIEADDFDSRLHARSLLGEDELAVGEILSGLCEQKRNLEREHMLSINILMQAVVVVCLIPEE